DRLHSDLQSKGIRSWFAPVDLKIGENIRRGIDESIRLYDKLLLILSKDSIASQWVEQEVETALAKERNQGRITLFPIRVDDTVMSVKSGWPSLIKNTRNIGDFREWKNYESYRKAFDRLVRDLKESETGGGDAR
ncbi:MAG: toll/interleukin-1 receptor domain-containing protein, partial [Blastocatellia bacterium]|nr:toll/interleukin-1 receptor domain-containing protein [Blastocatellia bacterium]